RQIARFADRLAQSSSSELVDAAHSPDPVLDDALQRLVGRISEVEAMASTDQLTRLLNRQACLGMLAVEIDRSNRYERPLTVALIDIDRFKRINDTYGHAVGDDLLRHVAGLLRASVRNVDALGRYGGEEFLLVMPETDVDGGVSSSENIRRIVGRAPLRVEVPNGHVETTITISIGVAGGSGTESLDIDRLLREADGALYSAKALGRDQVQAYRPIDEGSGVSRATIDAGARNLAIEIGQAAYEASNLQLLEVLRQRPGWAGGASQMIANLSADIGRAIGLSDGDIDRIKTASLLHDLGKIAIPDEILSKPAPLSPIEWRTIVEHPKIGQVMLEQAGAIRDAASIVLHHHEWFDGRGYPHGLAGHEIPIGSRIVAIADAYEAMISDRPYSPAMSHQDAIGELLGQRGSQFDPDLVDVFVALVGDGRTESGRQYGAPEYVVQPVDDSVPEGPAPRPKRARKPSATAKTAVATSRRRA
ncbi:MAG TPA: diguanylate cyclase, partial [Solirubrobacterales bacterium]|nr:diguanylate cyclase [Solirubrobacterales bacterium]